MTHLKHAELKDMIDFADNDVNINKLIFKD